MKKLFSNLLTFVLSILFIPMYLVGKATIFYHK